MIFKNLFCRKGRTILTLLGISIGVAAIVALGAVGGVCGIILGLGLAWGVAQIPGIGGC